ncbi:MAG: ATP-binding cassette domain-containing protein [Nitriliruptorales bacterium]|nr:ATP-binding cassette domain-containing protein [Nitriliruptorales bacterium]
MISVRGLTVDLGSARVLDGLNLVVAPGEWVTVVGPNGAGKSTMLRALAGVVPHRGEVALAGHQAGSLRRRQRSRLVSLVPQNPVVPEGIAVTDYVLLGRTPHLGPLGALGHADVAAAHAALARLDLLGLADRPVTTLSGGERQRVLLARALAQGAPILLLDEPTTALDVGHQQQVLELVDDLRGDHDLTVLSTMHDLTLAGQYADRVALLAGGRLAAEGAAAHVLTEELLARHYHARVRVLNEGGRPVVVPLRSAAPADLP